MKLRLLIFQSLVFTQSIYVISELDTTIGYVGGVISWSIEVKGAEKNNVRLPELNIDNDLLLFKSKNKINTDLNIHKLKFEIIAWDTGSFSTPNYAIEILDDNGKLDFFLDVPNVDFRIISIIEALGENKFRPIKGPVPVSNIYPIKTIFLLFLIVITLLGIFIIWKKREKVKYEKLDYSIIQNPKERALKRLDDLSLSNFSKDYYTNLSHISREYIETKYFIRTLEMTTDQIRQSRVLFPMDDNMFSDWLLFLSLADQVKYAREIPDKDKMLFDKEKIISLINQLD